MGKYFFRFVGRLAVYFIAFYRPYQHITLQLYFLTGFAIKATTILLLFAFDARNTQPAYHLLAPLEFMFLQAYNPCSEFPCCNEEDYHGLANDLVDIKIGLAQLVVEESGKIKKRIEEKTNRWKHARRRCKTLPRKTKE